jgi:hypothetical protein
MLDYDSEMKIIRYGKHIKTNYITYKNALIKCTPFTLQITAIKFPYYIVSVTFIKKFLKRETVV